MKKNFPVYLSLLALIIYTTTVSTGCANMIPPGGGPRDSLPPVLIDANPKDSLTNFTGKRIVLTFNEYVQIENVAENVIVSPTPNSSPLIENKLRTISIKLRDTLEPSTTCSINFGNAIKDLNEGNVLKNFTYVFSTGSTIDENTFTGKVILAETGMIDTTLIVVLHRNLTDSAVSKERPRYIARLDGTGNFRFENLPVGTFAAYVVPNDYSKKYDDTTKLFAFADKPILVSKENITPVTFYAFSLPKQVPIPPAVVASKDKQLRFNTSLGGGKQDLLSNLELNFIRKVTFDSTAISLTDKDFKRLNNYQFIADTNQTHFTIRYTWSPTTDFNLLLNKNAFKDSAGITLTKNDTIHFTTKNVSEYGSVRLRFRNLDLTRNPVLQLVQSEKVVESIPLPQAEWIRKLVQPGEYTLRILYDTNKNGVWDTGRFYDAHRQPEIVITLKTPFGVRANWDNLKDITLSP